MRVSQMFEAFKARFPGDPKTFAERCAHHAELGAEFADSIAASRQRIAELEQSLTDTARALGDCRFEQ